MSVIQLSTIKQTLMKTIYKSKRCTFLIFVFLLSLTITKSQTIVNGIYAVSSQNDCPDDEVAFNCVPGPTELIWDLAGSPYIVSGNVSFQGMTLRIDPGVIVKFQSGASMRFQENFVPVKPECSLNACEVFTFNGGIIANGTIGSPIIFTSISDDANGGDDNFDGNATSPGAGDWNNIIITDATTGTFSNCQFLYGGGTSSSPLVSEGGVNVVSCHFEECGSDPDNGFGVGVKVGIGSVFSFSNLTFGPNDLIGVGLFTGGAAGSYTVGNSGGIPYLFNDDFGRVLIKDDQTITIPAGTLFKSFDEGGIIVDGQLNIQGTSTNPVIFTSVLDDSYGGDTNQDGATTNPAAGDWRAITVNGIGTATIDYTEFYYGGGGTIGSNTNGTVLQNYGRLNANHCHFQSIAGPFLDNVGLGVALSSNHSIQNLTFGTDVYKGIGLFATRTNTTGSTLTYSLPRYPGLPYLVADPINNGNPRVRSDIVINVDPGVIIKLESIRGLIRIDGTLNCLGTANDPIIFTSLFDDTFDGDTNQDGSATSPARGDWSGVFTDYSSTINGIGNFEYCRFYYGGDHSRSGMTLRNYGTMTVTHCHFEESGNTSSFRGQGIGLGVALGSTHNISNLTFGTNDFIGIGLLDGAFSAPGASTLPRYPTYPYLLEDDFIRVDDDQQITLTPGTVFKFLGDNTYIDLEGTLLANGTVADPIVFTSILDDTQIGDTNQDGNATSPQRGDWNGLFTEYSNSYVGRGTFTHCQFYYGGQHSNSGMTLRNYGEITVDHCHFEESGNTSSFRGQGIGLGVAFGSTHTISNLTFGANDFAGIGLLNGTSSAPGTFNLPLYLSYPYVLEDASSILDDDQEVSVAAGTHFKFLGTNTFIEVEGTFNLNGTEADPIVFTSLLDDKNGGDTNQDGTSTTPNLGDYRGLWLKSSGTYTGKVNAEHCLFKYGGGSQAAIHGPGILNLKYGTFESNEKGLSIENANTVVDSSSFRLNDIGIVNEANNALVENSIFSGNLSYDAQNAVSTDLMAPRNQWDSTNIQASIDYLLGNSTNFASILDKQDNPALGDILIDPIRVPTGISRVDPDTAKINETAVSITLYGYRLDNTVQIILYRAGESAIPTTSQTVIDTITAMVTFDVSQGELGFYNVGLVTIEGDTISLMNGFEIVELDGLLVSAKVLLQGPFDAGLGMMSDALHPQIPTSQPYLSQFGYNGNESVTQVPDDMVDWVLISLIEELSGTVYQRAAFLREDGQVVDLNGTDPVFFPDVLAGNYQVQIQHRNHLGIRTFSFLAIGNN